MDEDTSNNASASNVPDKPGKLKAFYRECIRVLKVTKKPDRAEYMTVAKVAAIGLLIIGLIGFIMFSLKQLLIG